MTSRIEKLLKAYAEGKGGDIVKGEAPSRIEAILEKIIENRPFYDEETEVETILSEEDWVAILNSDQDYAIPNAFMEPSREYTVTFNGISSTYTAWSYNVDGKTICGIGDGPEVLMNGATPTIGFIYADVATQGMCVMLPTDQDLLAKNWGIDFSTLTSIVVRVSDMQKGTYTKKISGKYVEDMYWAEVVHDNKVYVDNREFTYGIDSVEDAIGEDLPYYNGNFGTSGRRIVEFSNGETYETDIISCETVIEGITIGTYILGNPSNLDSLSSIILPIIYTNEQVTELTKDNGLPFTLTWSRHPDISPTICMPYVGGTNMHLMAYDADASEECIASNQRAWNLLSDYSPLTIRGADSEVIHKVPEKYLPEMNNEELEERVTALENKVPEMNNEELEERVTALENKVPEMNNEELEERVTALENAEDVTTSLTNYIDFLHCLSSLASEITRIEDSEFLNDKELVLTNLPSGVTYIGGYAFQYCSKLALTELPSGVTYIGMFAFAECIKLALTELPSGVAYIGACAFAGCPKLALTKLPSGLTRVESCAFNSCGNMPLVTLPSGLTYIGDRAFAYCGKLCISSIPEGVTHIEEYAFLYCSGIKILTFKGTPTSIAADAFTNCDNLINIYVPWAEGEVANAPWGATNATIHYNHVAE